ncbi:uncharacterized protein LOC134178620 [Corticium candelabrum]|uniref:uncharacterized protein LOC134178620 n=1 Tax=Corticium candelabrum TaxID=121492 RepID=UPI002E25239D|nr:uncharacterized protein LOC134178620 [Corticium candelabrum]XP_062501487.1 uncharacterized protein LOC134178620 [Corticium candelabrum]
MTIFCARICVCFVLVSVYFASVSAFALKQRSTRPYVCNGHSYTREGDYSRCLCGLRFRRVTTICCQNTTFYSPCSTVSSRHERKSCLASCPRNQQPRLQSVRFMGSSYQTQCSCSAGYAYDNQTGCCVGACRGCRSYQRCITRKGIEPYCEDMCTGYPCRPGQECYLTTSQCQLVGGIQICPRVARCRDLNPCYPLQCKSYQRCRARGNIQFCEDTCEGYTGCQNYEECHLREVRYCVASNCAFGGGVACRLRATKPGSCLVTRATHCYTSIPECSRDDHCSGSSKCCHDGCISKCTPVLDSNKPVCVDNTQILRTNGPSFFIHYPGRITNTTCGQFEGSLVIIATNGLCINVSTDVRYPDLKIGETIKVYDGYKSKHLLYQGQSFQNVHIASSERTMTIVFTTPDIGASNGTYLFVQLQSTCQIADTVNRSEVVTTPNNT